MTEQFRAIRRALISVSDKTGIVELGKALGAAGVEILSTGGTYSALHAAGVEVVEVSRHTGSPEIMDGRVKTLHPKIHGGILGRRGVDDAVMLAQDIAPIDLVVVNLYPFVETLRRADCTDALAIENIDIGGPAMLRAAAKNHLDVWVISDPADYEHVIECVGSGKGSSFAQRRDGAAQAYRHTAGYDAAVAEYLTDEDLPARFTATYEKKMALRYGENPHQRAAFYVESAASVGSVAAAVQLQGKELSYNNIADTDAALECVKSFEQTACVIVKHANPCGVAIASTIGDAYERAFATDQTSAFGGIIAFNRELDETTLAQILERQFVEVVIAPTISAGAVEVAKRKKNVRLLECGDVSHQGDAQLDTKRVRGGLLVQDADRLAYDASKLRVVSQRVPTDQERRDLLFAWNVAWFVKSNAIVYARDEQTLGIGAGQMSRVVSAKIAGLKAAEEGLEVPGAVMASDAFFPFRDGIDAAAEAGIAAVIQPGGSMRDEEVIAAANEHAMAMLFTGTRHFRH